jgi:hypothetical protein
MTNNLYLISADTPDGDNADWFVVAADPSQALALYRGSEWVRDFEPTIEKVRAIVPNYTAHPIGVVEWDEFATVIG